MSQGILSEEVLTSFGQIEHHPGKIFGEEVGGDTLLFLKRYNVSIVF